MVFEKQTTIILGAGASVQCGFPLGGELHSEILIGIGQFERQAQSNSPWGLPSIGTQNAEEFKDKPFMSLAAYLSSSHARELLPPNLPSSTPGEALIVFRNDLRDQPHDSIDRFIRDNPQHQFIGKLLLCQNILLPMYSYSNGIYELKKFSEREYHGRRNWYNKLVNLVSEGASSHKALNENKLYIVTFNYDLSLEQSLINTLFNAEIHRGGSNYQDVVKVLHVNGKPTELPKKIGNVGEFLLNTAAGLHLVEEEVGSDLEETRMKARSAIANSARVYIMGFHFDEANIRTIGLRDASEKSRIFCQNFDGHLGVKNQILDLGIQEEAIMSGSQESPLHIDQAIDNGFLQQ